MQGVVILDLTVRIIQYVFEKTMKSTVTSHVKITRTVEKSEKESLNLV